MKKEEKELHNREVLAIASYCRSYLYYSGFLSDDENIKVHERVRKFQDKNKVEIRHEQLDSVEISYFGK